LSRYLIVGSYLSPYVRKVLVCFELKGIAYEIDPIVPFYGNEEFTRLSPVRRIPVLIDSSGLTVADSTVICEYLEDAYPETPLFPGDAPNRARARWIEEYADSRMGEVFIWRVFNQLVINRFVWGASKDEAVLERAIKAEIPQILDYLERILPKDGFLFGDISVADIAVASFFRNLALARRSPDLENWPVTGAFVARMLDHQAFRTLKRFEEVSISTPIDRHRAALLDAGAPVSSKTYFNPEPRRGILSI
jgi:glutathione S-transferase